MLPLQIFDEFCKDEDLGYDSNNFKVKLDVQSPGFMEISGVDIGGIIILGIILVSIAGGGFSLKFGDKLSVGMKTDGIIEKVRKFLQTKSSVQTEKKLLEKHLEKLQVQDVKELIDVLKEINKDK